jgi:hypothetical protein
MVGNAVCFSQVAEHGLVCRNPVAMDIAAAYSTNEENFTGAAAVRLFLFALEVLYTFPQIHCPPTNSTAIAEEANKQPRNIFVQIQNNRK